MTTSGTTDPVADSPEQIAEATAVLRHPVWMLQIAWEVAEPDMRARLDRALAASVGCPVHLSFSRGILCLLFPRTGERVEKSVTADPIGDLVPFVKHWADTIGGSTMARWKLTASFDIAVTFADVERAVRAYEQEVPGSQFDPHEVFARLNDRRYTDYVRTRRAYDDKISSPEDEVVAFLHWVLDSLR